MRTGNFFLISCAALLINFCSVELFAETKMEIECKDRINQLDRDLKQVLSSGKYSKKKRKAFRTAKKNSGLDRKSYEASIAALRNLMIKDENGRVPNGNALKCILDAGGLVQQLDSLAARGGRNLDYFSKDWKKYFPSYAKLLRYTP